MVIKIWKKKLWLTGFIAVIIIAVAAWAIYTVIHTSTPVRIGVLLPLTGDIDLKEPLLWAKDNINRQGGIGGRPIELVYKDTENGNITKLANELLADDSIRIVIGPDTSDNVYLLAPAFIDKKKILISPEATSGDIIRAFGKKGYFWRTTQGDVAQAKIIILTLKEKGVKKAALLAENSTYGNTFYDWTGFFANEYGINLIDIRKFNEGSSDLGDLLSDALKTDPDYIIAACGPSDAVSIKKMLDKSGSRTKLFLTDAAVSPVLIQSLGPEAEGILGTSPTSDPTTGFSVAYKEKFGHEPTYYAAPTYDAILLAAYTSARQERTPFESLDDSFRNVVYGNGTIKGWDAQESYEAITDILNGKLPGVSGASGPLDYDTDFGVDPLVTWYSNWIVEAGDFRTLSTISSEKTGALTKSGESVARSKASSDFMSDTQNITDKPFTEPAKTNFMAVIVGPSRGWANYRHESDALAMYTLLRENGVDNDHIILMTYDDIPSTVENPIPGDIHNFPKGENLRSKALVDYSCANVTSEILYNVLTGNKASSTPVVLESNASTDVFVYIASHGIPGGIIFRGNDTLTIDDFANLTNKMNQDRHYRQIVFFVDTCFGESVARKTTAPGILYLTGAARNEPSLGAVYDMNISQWLSDEFTSSVISLIRSDPNITFRELYTATYEKVTGSHVHMITTGNASTLDEPVLQFLKP